MENPPDYITEQIPPETYPETSPETYPETSPETSINYTSYFLLSKYDKLTNGHLESKKLYPRILSHDGTTAYCGYFNCDKNNLKTEIDTGKVDSKGKPIYEYKLLHENPLTFARYQGVVSPALNYISFDFDSEDPNNSLNDVRKFVSWLDIDDAVTFFSGNKGFHVMVPFGYFGLEPSDHLHLKLRDLAKHLKTFYKTLDSGIYDTARKFRVPFTRHEKSGLYKVVVDPDNSIEQILELAKTRVVVDFLKNEKREPLGVLTDLLKTTQRESYSYEKREVNDDNINAIVLGSTVEEWDNKLCIKKMLKHSCNNNRNNACMRIVDDYYKTGKLQKDCEKDLVKWATDRDLPLEEVTTIITNTYQRGAEHNFGCQDELKAHFCNPKCKLYVLLTDSKKPLVVGAPPPRSIDKEKLKEIASIPEFDMVKWLMESFFDSYWDKNTRTFSAGTVIKHDCNRAFHYKDHHWQFIDEMKEQELKTKINANYNNMIGSRKLDNIFDMFILYVPAKPPHVDLFSPRDDVANFLDGTLHLVRSHKEQSYRLEFREHSKLDYCTTMFKANYREYIENTERKNNKFEAWLFDYLNEDQEAFNLVQEMFGATLMPRFPQFFMIIGPSGTGKSTVMKVIRRLHGECKYISGVTPDMFTKFNMQSMIGCTINMCMDINTRAILSDHVVKQIDDRVIMRIEWKGKDDVYTKLPGIHIFGANKMPTTLEGYSGAMNRRFSIIDFEKVFKGKKDDMVADYMFEHDELGVFCFALNGLKRLVENNTGRYSTTKKSVDNVDEWSKQSDPFWQFIQEAEYTAVGNDQKLANLTLDNNAKISKMVLWGMFEAWQKIALDPFKQVGKISFYNMVKDAGFKEKRSDDGRFFCGILEKPPVKKNQKI